MTLSRSAPPHTRGSAHPTPQIIRWIGGSPAHAGIGPNGGDPSLRRARLPRTRGDRPDDPGLKAAAEMAPPHTRGSARSAGVFGNGCVGSPAHAGIGP
ncbi:hypothetical protein Amme_021_010 [Acidomonas methanolica NBRC 104435]|uniref:Uncharacterized protein n=1 Tax=Acidomonas methanolica NBRC 104435 TaxID=1231351 RepID=A0A023D3N9_ACIMT|nr:hypothetical protein Amme_021_010 [Acidomonas methanolica NBRC 104435]